MLRRSVSLGQCSRAASVPVEQEDENLASLREGCERRQVCGAVWDLNNNNNNNNNNNKGDLYSALTTIGIARFSVAMFK